MTRVRKVMLFSAGAASILLTACMPEWDRNGQDPRINQTLHPHINTLEKKEVEYITEFGREGVDLSEDEKRKLKKFLVSLPVDAAEKLTVEMSPFLPGLASREKSLRRVLHSMGVNDNVVAFSRDKSLEGNSVRLRVVYAMVVPPEGCPDWEDSSRHSYANAMHSNLRCATVTNLGQMVVDPHDLIKGHGETISNPDRNAKVLGEYYNNQTSSTSSSASTSGSGR